ncbi:MAG TPA: hypothetical protein VI854_04195, partial [Acidimicrobiia bacterium]|nr:hypothetical protein [Acidimicrobiia bacterium]
MTPRRLLIAIVAAAVLGTGCSSGGSGPSDAAAGAPTATTAHAGWIGETSKLDWGSGSGAGASEAYAAAGGDESAGRDAVASRVSDAATTGVPAPPAP